MLRRGVAINWRLINGLDKHLPANCELAEHSSNGEIQPIVTRRTPTLRKGGTPTSYNQIANSAARSVCRNGIAAASRVTSRKYCTKVQNAAIGADAPVSAIRPSLRNATRAAAKAAE
jgi:hypothetical protein